MPQRREKEHMPTNYFNIPLYKDTLLDINYLFAKKDQPKLPILTKTDVKKAFPQVFMTAALKDAIAAGKVEFAFTSGTSERLQIVRPKGWWSTEFTRAYHSIPDMSNYEIGAHRKAVLTGAICSASACWRDKPTLIDRATDGVLSLNFHNDPNQWTRGDIERIDYELRTFAPQLLEVNPNYLAIFLSKRALYNLQAPLFRPRWITASYDLLTHRHRNFIESAFNVPVFSMFGSTEIGVIFLQNSRGEFVHNTAEHFLELRPFLADRGIYELIITCWKNPFMPLLRYATGDLVQVTEGQKVDSIFDDTRPLKISRLHGRAKDAIVLHNEKILTAAELDDECYKQVPMAFQYQYQHSDEQLPTLLWTVDPSEAESTKRQQSDAAKTITLDKDVKIQLRQVSSLRTKLSGKFPTVRQSTSPIECRGKNLWNLNFLK